jgi:hypothetical protein
MAKSSRQKISKDLVELKSIIHQLDKNHIYKQFIHKQQITRSTQLLRSFIQTDHVLDHEKHLNKFKRTGIKQHPFSDPQEIKLARKLTRKLQNVSKQHMNQKSKS